MGQLVSGEFVESNFILPAAEVVARRQINPELEPEPELEQRMGADPLADSAGWIKDNFWLVGVLGLVVGSWGLGLWGGPDRKLFRK